MKRALEHILGFAATVVLLVAFAIPAQTSAQGPGGPEPGEPDTSRDVVIAVGADLSPEQRDIILVMLGVQDGQVMVEPGVFRPARVLAVTNAEERQYLGGVVPEDKIGTRAISSARVIVLKPGEGIEVSTSNVDWVTPEMYASALATAGVRDASVMVTAPATVSGTAALAGIIKAFEAASGREIPEEGKRAATIEVVRTGEIGERIGDPVKATQVVTRAKRQVIERKVASRDEVVRIVKESARRSGVTLTDEEVDKLADLMMQVRDLKLDSGELEKQLSRFGSAFDRIFKEKAGGSFWSWLSGIIRALVEWIRGLFGR